jgi:deoxyribodipyrimidine photolyase
MMDISNKQLKKWDPDCVYVRKWLPHLKGVPNEYLFDWDEANSKKFKGIHPGPIFDSKKRLEEWVDACRGL